MDSTARRPQLPPIGFLEQDKVRREEDPYQERKPVMAPIPAPPAPAASPAHQYPTHPPPPYSQPAPPVRGLPITTPPTPADMRTPPESRRTSGDEKEAIKQNVRQSLPSISEALGVESQPAYHAPMPSQTTPSSAHPPPPRAAMASSPSPRSHGMEPPQHPPQHPSEHHAPPPQHHQYRQDTPHQQHYPPVDAPRHSYGEARSHLHATRSPPPRPSQHPGQYPSSTTQQSPGYDQQAPPPSSAMGPPSFPYGYQPYPPRYAQPTPPASVSAAPIYQPSLSSAAPPPPTSGWKSEGPRHGGEERPYGDSVKRQLDMYDLEGALNDITRSSSIVTDFAKRYSDRLHQTQRSGPTLSTLPSITEIEDMVTKSRLQLDSLTKIHEVVRTQQVAYEQQVAEQRQQQKAYAEPLMPAHPQDLEDAKAGFAGSDPKKRRGRAAPPGRCHSCNRAETPEWRRGPDGARTLCNACGLHYAKLTRKQNNANKNTAVNNSNLRPKESMS